MLRSQCRNVVQTEQGSRAIASSTNEPMPRTAHLMSVSPYAARHRMHSHAALSSARVNDQHMANREQMSFPRYALRGFVLLMTIGSAVSAAEAAWNHDWLIAILGFAWSLLGVAILVGPATVLNALRRGVGR